MAYVDIKNVNKSFGSLQVLKDVSFSLNKGEVLSIIGSSGSGKTTLLRCINFLESVDTGTFELDGETMFDGSIKDLSDGQKREKRLSIGLVFQNFNLFPHYSILKNITLAPELLLKESIKNKNKSSVVSKNYRENKEYYFGNEEISEKEIRRVVEEKGIELLKKVGLENKVDYYPHQLSGGQQQRAAIARALALNPELLCFDEPTSALDPELTGEVLRVIKSLKDDERTMLIVTHEMGFAKNVSDKVLFMADGKVEEFGTPEEIFDNPQSEKLQNFLSVVENKDGV
ncbi:MAG: amino acid ABC transporter ATP-binding protein [Clostridiales bacterium]|nr:amino acid ABC transporter ATP-binding protein [Clostridiales bacterium]